ncbi:MAG: AAA family ATPase [Clostridia bacterium]|nr:AAA family ATPase [Clostridia bacterium]
MTKRIVVASGKGGVGKTTVCVGVGRALTALGHRTLLVDFDDLRSLDLVAGVAERVVYDWGDVLLGRCEPQDALNETDGLFVLAGPRSYADITKEQVRDLMRRFDDFDYILMDAPAGVGTGFCLACGAAPRGIVVATADPVSVRSAAIAAEKMQTLGVGYVRLLLNRAAKKDMKKKRLMNIDDAIDGVSAQLLGIIPEDRHIRLREMGGTLLEKHQISTTPFMNVAKRVTGENVPLFFL